MLVIIIKTIRIPLYLIDLLLTCNIIILNSNLTLSVVDIFMIIFLIWIVFVIGLLIVIQWVVCDVVVTLFGDTGDTDNTCVEHIQLTDVGQRGCVHVIATVVVHHVHVFKEGGFD